MDNAHTWEMLNLNAIIYKDIEQSSDVGDLFDVNSVKQPIVYFGAHREGRKKYFAKYFTDRMVVSTAKKNLPFFHGISTSPSYIDKLNWYGENMTIQSFKAILYIEDEITHDNYNFLANRFYESLSYGVPCFFDASCSGTIAKSGYDINPWYIVDSSDELWIKLDSHSWPDYNFEGLRAMAKKEKASVLEEIKHIICG